MANARQATARLNLVPLDGSDQTRTSSGAEPVSATVSALSVADSVGDADVDADADADAEVGARSLHDEAQALAQRFADASAIDILRFAIGERFAGRVAMVSSFGAESACLLHLIASIDPQTPVLFIDTGKHFAQTLAYRRKLARHLGLQNIITVEAGDDALAADDAGGDLWRRDPDACCHLRKTRPLRHALSGYDAWITGRKQFHSESRARLPIFEASEPHIKINPIARWTPDDIAAYSHRFDLPPHPLVAEGFPSIGCWPCTHPASGDDVRAGRWRGSAKTECGIHEMAGRR